jgi:two-component sensor histidine kinase
VETSAPAVAELRLAERNSSAALARQFTRSTLAAWQGGQREDDVGDNVGDNVEDIVLVVSELVTNALLHGHGTPVVRLLAGGDHVRVEVCDDSPLLPVSHRVTPTSGLGLRAVEQLSSAWGASRRDHGKVVWCELPTTPEDGIPA